MLGCLVRRGDTASQKKRYCLKEWLWLFQRKPLILEVSLSGPGR